MEYFYKIACAPSEDSDQPAQSDPSLRCQPENSLDLWLLAVHRVVCEDSDHIARMRRLI